MTMCNIMSIDKFVPRIQRTLMLNPIARLSNKWCCIWTNNTGHRFCDCSCRLQIGILQSHSLSHKSSTWATDKPWKICTGNMEPQIERNIILTLKLNLHKRLFISDIRWGDSNRKWRQQQKMEQLSWCALKCWHNPSRNVLNLVHVCSVCLKMRRML